MKRQQLNPLLVGMLAMAGWLCQACDVENLSESLTEGTVEEYVIADKNSGTLQVNEKYEAYAAMFDIAENPYQIKTIEFMADGTYYITFDTQAPTQTEPYEDYYVKCQVEGRQLRVPLRTGHNTTRLRIYDLPSTGTYTYENGRYKLSNLQWEMYGQSLLVEVDGQIETYTAIPRTPKTADALTRRLCHTWKLSDVLLKLYRMDNSKKSLITTYHMTEEEVRDNCIDTFVFSKYGSFYRYKDGKENGIGLWNWSDVPEQQLRYQFTYFSEYDNTPVVGSNDLTVYFSGNRLYLTEWCEALDENDWGDDEKEHINLKALLLYRLEVKGN